MRRPAGWWCGRRIGYGDQAVRIDVGQLLQRNGFQNAETSGVRAYAQRERSKHDCGKSRRFGEGSQSETDVLKQDVEPVWKWEQCA